MTPYRNREQIASGALTFAIAAGCGVVSTPYWYAQDMLAIGRGHARAVRRSGRARRRGLRLHRAARAARGGPGRGAADRLGARLAVGRRGDRGRPREALALAPRRRPVRRRRPPSRRACAPTTCSRSSTTSGSSSTRNGIIPNRDSGYCVDDVARLAVVSLALAAAATSRLWTSILYRVARVPARGHRRRRDAQLHELRPPLARRAARRRPRRPLGLGARRDPRHRLDPRRRRPGARPARAARRGALRRRLAANGRLHGARPLAPRRRPARARGAERLLERLVEQLADAYDAHRDRGLALVRGRAQLRQRAALAGADRRRQRARPRRPRRSSGSSRCAGSATSRARRDDVLRLTGHRGRRRDEPAHGDGRRAAARRRGARRGRAGRVRVTRRPRARGRGRRRRSSGSSAATACRGRSTTSRPAAAATGSAARR